MFILEGTLRSNRTMPEELEDLLSWVEEAASVPTGCRAHTLRREIHTNTDSAGIAFPKRVFVCLFVASARRRFS